ncbi:hypothetical protein KKG45_01735 [bacterium]|nr:hypothetical protein [bacterium]MBU1071947.1 hypothetical protein [bacterium]
MRFLGLLPAACVVASVAAAAPGEAPRIRNAATAPGGVETWNLAETWRAGGEDDDIFFGVITDAKLDGEGNVMLLDMQLSRIYVYDSDGERLRAIGRDGDGPGEFRQASDLVSLPRDRIGVVAGFPGKIIALEQDGTPAPSISPGEATEGGFSIVFGAECAGDRLVLCGAKLARSDAGMNETRYLSICDLDGRETRLLLSKEKNRDFNRPVYNEAQEYFVMRRWTIGPDGRIYAAPERDTYAVYVYSPAGELERIIEREYTPRERTQDEKDEVGSELVIMTPNGRLQMEREVLDHEPCVFSMFVDRDGLLWVADGHSGKHDGVFRRYDVFDPDGRFVKQVDLVADGDADEDGLLALGDGRFVLVRGLTAASDAMTAGFDEADDDDTADLEEDDPLEVILLRRGA